MKKYFYLLIIITVLLFSCKEGPERLKLLKVTEFSSSKIGDTTLVNFFRKHGLLDIEIAYTLSEDEALDQLEENKVDLLIIPNNTRGRDTEIRTLTPLLPRVLMILTNKEVDTMNVKDLFEKGIIYFEDRSRLDSIVFNKLFYNFNIDESKINAKLTENLDFKKRSDSLEVFVGLTHLNNALVKKLTNSNWHFYSLDDIENYRKGSRIEGFTMMNSSGYPFVIPMSVYKGKPKTSVLTFAINDILVCRADLDEDVAYMITKTLVENKAKLAEKNSIYNLLNFDYDSHTLSFPKHRGTKKYLDKDEPPVWFKYVKMVWPLVSISVVIFGIFASLRQRLRRRKKQNIEIYYNTLLDIRAKADEAVEVGILITLLKELKILRSQAMKSLANKKLDPGESFNIFLALFNDTKTELIDDIKEVRLKNEKAKD